MRYVLIGILTASMGTGCAGIAGQSLFMGEDEGRVLVDTDRAGLEALFQGLNGLVVTGKSAPNMRDAYHDTQESNLKTRKFAILRNGKAHDIGGAK